MVQHKKEDLQNIKIKNFIYVITVLSLIIIVGC